MDITTLILFILGFVILIKGADLLVDGASSIAKKMKISAIVIGLTIVSFGTSAPEFVVNLIASLNGSTDLSLGNVLGSNIANVLLVLGVTATVYPLVTKANTVWKEIPFALLGSILLGVMLNDMVIEGAQKSGLTRIDGIVLLAFFIIFMYYTYGIAHVQDDEISHDDIPSYSYPKSILYIILGLLGLIFGGQWLVDGAVSIANSFGVSEAVIGLTIVAIGTSLPELVTSIVAAYKKQTDIAIGNIVGSNIFNIFWILGFSSLVAPIPYSPEQQSLSVFTSIFSVSLLFVIMFIGQKFVIQRWQGILMICIYFAYLGYLTIW